MSWRRLRSGMIFPAASGGTPGDTGFVIAGAGATVNTGSGPVWTDPGNITADDATNASSSVFASATSDDLKASNFGFSIPGGATIDGIEVRAQLAASFGPDNYVYVNVGKDDSTLATNKNPGVATTTTPTNYDSGGSSDLWGLSWTAAEINASTFQVRIRTQNGSFLNSLCDAIWAKIYYTPAAGGADEQPAAQLIGI